MRRGLASAALASLVLGVGACMVRRTDPVELGGFRALAGEPTAAADAARPSVVLWVSLRPFGSEHESYEDHDRAERQRLLEVVRATGWFEEVRLDEPGEAADLRLEARFREEVEGDADVLGLVSLLTLGLWPSGSSELVSLDLALVDSDGAVRGEVTRAERFTVRAGWIFLPFLFSTSLGEVRAAVREDLTRAALGDARQFGWL